MALIQQKNALIVYLLTHPELQVQGVQDADGLFEFFLIDAQMSSCLQTSWIKQAISTVQLFVQGRLLGLKPLSRTGAIWATCRYPGYELRTVVKRECKNSSSFCHRCLQGGKIMIPRYLMDLNLLFLILYSEFVYLLWL